MFDKLKDVFSSGRKKKKPKIKDIISSEEVADIDFLEFRETEEADLAVIDMDKIPLEEQDELRKAVVKLGDIPFFEGEVEHFYTFKYTKQVHQCPRCGGLLQQRYANWIYAVMSGKQRIMLTSAGYFCPKCPTVIIDEEEIKDGIVGNYKYREIISIQYENGDVSGIETLNGKEVIAMIHDEETGDISWIAKDEIPSGYARFSTKKTFSNRKSSQRRRMQKNSKKQQRAKKKKKRKRK